MASSGIDPITLEVIRNGLLAVTSEMKSVVVRSAVSPLWKDAGDVSCAILTTEAEAVAQGRGDIPVHLATMPFSMRGILDQIRPAEIAEGDVLIQNDPYSGGNTHLPDFLMAVPVFARGEVMCFVGVRGHWTDVGGAVYSATAREIYEEGLRVPPTRLYRAGELNRDVLGIVLANTRNPSDRWGDIQSQYAGCKVGEARTKKIIDRYGPEAVRQAMAEILNRSERLTRAEILDMPDGVYRFVDYLDDSGVGETPIKIQVAVTIAESGITVDFSGTDEQTSAGINNTYAATASAAYFAIKCLTDPWNPANSGCYRPVRVIAPEGSLVNCRLPAPVAAYHETQVRICDAIFGALGQAIPERVPAAGYGSQGGLVVISGVDPRPECRGRRFTLYEVAGGPSGGTHRQDGLHGTRVGTGNAGNIPVESVEIHHPVMIEAYEIVPDTCGAGRARGGCAVRRVYRVLARQATMATIFERAKFRPYGLFGGEAGAPATVRWDRGQGAGEVLPPKSRPFAVPPDGVISVQTAGGGGYGNPFERDPELVRRDVVDGLITVARAARDYGVVIQPDTRCIDWEATDRSRQAGRSGAGGPEAD